MSIPLRQALVVGAYVLKQRLQGRKRFPLVLMLEPLFRCNLACAGCGKIQHPTPILRQNLSPEACFQAVEECGAPVVSIAGGEPLLHPHIDEIAAGLVARKKFVYLCTNALLLEKHLGKFTRRRTLLSVSTSMVSRNAMMSWYAARAPLTSPSRPSRLPRKQASASLPTRRSSRVKMPRHCGRFLIMPRPSVSMA